MISEKMMMLGKKRSVIRDIFEYAKARAAEIGAENIFDFSIGNPSVPAPDCLNEAICELTNSMDSVELHGYTSAQGDAGVRKTIADSLNNCFSMHETADDIYMTVGAAASLTISLNAIVCDGDEVILIAPFFPEYTVFAEKAGAKTVVIQSRDGDLQIDIPALKAAITEKTKAVIINSPNNPSGVVLTEENLKEACAVLASKQAEYGHEIFIITDEPYRELVYDGISVPCIHNMYQNTIMCYSYSKSLSIPGERIGYIAVNHDMPCRADVYAAVCGAGRALGYVCASSMFQRVAAMCEGKTADVNVYKENRDLLYSSLSAYGFECVKPDGAFYLFMKTPEPDAAAFCEKAKKYELLLVPADSFGSPGYVRIAYCVTNDKIKRSLPAFEKLAKEYRLI